MSKSSPEVRTPPPTTSRKPLIIEIVDEDVTPSTPEDEKAAQPATSTSGREDEYLSIASVAALAAAAYVSGAELHGVDALPDGVPRPPQPLRARCFNARLDQRLNAHGVTRSTNKLAKTWRGAWANLHQF